MGLGISTSFGASFAALLLTVSLSGCVPAKHAAPASPPAAVDIDALHCRDLLAALIADSPEAAEKDFSAPVRSGLPPPQLRVLWHGLEAKHGALASWRVVKRDNPEGTDRFTLELQFAQGTMHALVVFEPAGKVVGLFS